GCAGDGGVRSCRRSSPLDVDEPCELAERRSAIAEEPAVAAGKQHEPAPAIALGLEPRAAERDGYAPVLLSHGASPRCASHEGPVSIIWRTAATPGDSAPPS